VFCQIIAGKIPAHKIYEDEQTLAFLDLAPVNPGHALVVPKTHADHLWELDDDQYSSLMFSAKKVANRIREILSPPRVGEAVEGFAVPHAHVHLMPIYKHLREEFNKPKPDLSADDLAAMAAKLKF